MKRLNNYDSKLIQISEGNLRNSHIYLRSALDMIPKDAIGGTNRGAPGAPITVRFIPGATVETDLPIDKLFLRCRKEVGQFFREAGIGANDFVQFTRLGDREFEIRKSGVLRNSIPDSESQVQPAKLKLDVPVVNSESSGGSPVQASIFIGYRREDAADACSRIYDSLRPVFGPDALFMDIDNIPYGSDFRAYVRSILPKCSVFLAIIGPRWADARHPDGSKRLDDVDDLVRVEIEIALATQGLELIPVLVNGAPMPLAQNLPASLQPLQNLNAARVRREDFHDDMRRLTEALKERVRARPLSVRKQLRPA